jgi:hypothetical protein
MVAQDVRGIAPVLKPCAARPNALPNDCLIQPRGWLTDFSKVFCRSLTTGRKL